MATYEKYTLTVDQVEFIQDEMASVCEGVYPIQNRQGLSLSSRRAYDGHGPLKPRAQGMYWYILGHPIIY